MRVRQASKHELAAELAGRYRAAGRAETGRLLEQVWEASDRICGKRLAPSPPELVVALERHGEVQLGAEVHTDNRGEFINAVLVPYCRHSGFGFTRGRPYKKNDQAFVE